MVTVRQFDSLSECIKLAQNKETDSETLKLIYSLYSLNNFGWSGILERSLAENQNTPSEIKKNLVNDYSDFDDFVDKMFQEQ